MTTCAHCKTRLVMDRPHAKVCLSCFSFGLARLLDEQGIIPDELDDLNVGQIAKIFGAGWDDFALTCYTAVLVPDDLEKTLDTADVL